MYAEISIPILVFIRNGLIYDRNKSEEYGGNFVSKERNNRNFKLKNTNIGKGQAKSKSAKSSKPKANRRPQSPTKPSVKVSFLGGLNEIGKNITLIECEGDMIIIDCGMAFPDGDMLGVDLVIPDFTYIEQNFDKVKGIVLTHGHEDHIGGLPYLLSRVNIPIYGTPLTLGLVGNKLKEHSLFNKTNYKRLTN